MNELERAATALTDRPVAPIAPLEMIERRAGTIRRRRRGRGIGAVVLTVGVLLAGGLVVRDAQAGRSPLQGVFVGQGPAASTVPGGDRFCLQGASDPAAVTWTVRALRARFSAVDRSVQVDAGPPATASSCQTIIVTPIDPTGFDDEFAQMELVLLASGDSLQVSDTTPPGSTIGTAAGWSGPRRYGLLGASGATLVDGSGDGRGREVHVSIKPDLALWLISDACTVVTGSGSNCAHELPVTLGSLQMGRLTSLSPAGSNDAKAVLSGPYPSPNTAAEVVALVNNPLPAGVSLIGSADPVLLDPKPAVPLDTEATVSTFDLGVVPGAAVSQTLIVTIQDRFRLAGVSDVSVQIEGRSVKVAAAASEDVVKQLVTSVGGLNVWPVLGELARTNRGCGPSSDTGSVVISPVGSGGPLCLTVGTDNQMLPGSSRADSDPVRASDGSYRTNLVLDASSAKALREGWVGREISRFVLLAGSEFILAESSSLTGTAEVRLTLTGLATSEDAARWRAILLRPLPPGVTFFFGR